MDLGEYNWGDCTKPGVHVVKVDDRKRGNFTWLDKTCGDFDEKEKENGSN